MKLIPIAVKNELEGERTNLACIRIIGIILAAGILFTMLILNSNVASANNSENQNVVDKSIHSLTLEERIAALPHFRNLTNEQRKAIAVRNAQERMKKQATSPGRITIQSMTMNSGGIPDYFGTIPNYANSPVPAVDPNTGVISGGIRKFVDSLPGPGPAGTNNLGQYIPIAVSDTTTYNGSDYYEIGLIEYTEKMHSDLNKTTLRGYVQLSTAKVPGQTTSSFEVP